MVRVTTLLYRIPVIKFRKGGLSGPSQPTPPPTASPSQTGQVRTQPATAMSTGPINDFELPPKYRRQPLSQEEIDHINGGGIEDGPSLTIVGKKTSRSDGVTIISVPRTTILGDDKKKEEISLNIIIQKVQKKS